MAVAARRMSSEGLLLGQVGNKFWRMGAFPLWQSSVVARTRVLDVKFDNGVRWRFLLETVYFMESTCYELHHHYQRGKFVLYSFMGGFETLHFSMRGELRS